MLWLGILFGLAAACSQSFSYVFSRRFIVGGHGSPLRVLVQGHVLMGLISLVLLPVLWNERAADIGGYWWWLLGAAGFYLVGQGAFFAALRLSEASRLAPLMGLKVVVIALLWAGVLGQAMSAQQWAAVGLSVVAAFMLNYTGGTLPLRSVAAVLAACLMYALSDIHIVRLIDAVSEPGEMSGIEGVRGPMLAACLSYIVCGLASAALLPWLGSRRGGDWAAAAPFAGAWYAAMYGFFTCLALAGPVLGNIVLSTRGIWSIAIGIALAALGHEHLEQKVSRGVLIRRIAAAGLMIGAIALYEV